MGVLDDIDLTTHIRLLGWLSVGLCLITWAAEFAGLVTPCVYCQTERTAIGVVGIVMIMQHHRYVTMLFGLAIAFLGAEVAAAQILLIIKSATFMPIYSVMAPGALFVLTGQALLIVDRARRAEVASR